MKKKKNMGDGKLTIISNDLRHNRIGKNPSVTTGEVEARYF